MCGLLSSHPGNDSAGKIVEVAVNINIEFNHFYKAKPDWCFIVNIFSVDKIDLSSRLSPSDWTIQCLLELSQTEKFR